MTRRPSANSNEQQSRPKPEASNPLKGSVHRDEIILVDTLCRRYGLKRHSRRQLRNRGLKMVRFGSKDFTTGKWFQEFLERLAEQQQQEATA